MVLRRRFLQPSSRPGGFYPGCCEMKVAEQELGVGISLLGQRRQNPNGFLILPRLQMPFCFTRYSHEVVYPEKVGKSTFGLCRIRASFAKILHYTTNYFAIQSGYSRADTL